MGESVTIDFHAPCVVCDRKIGPVQPWVPHGRVIVHSRCHVDAFHDFCSERDLPISDESYRAFSMWLDEQDEPSFLDPDELEPNRVTFDDPATDDREAW